ncbi:thymidylate synthase [Archaeoglobales archaeon]|nr:MAG: thymidylate synthase [Archaeoglobales archaeon]
MIISKDWNEARSQLLAKILDSGKMYKSRFGDTLRCEPNLVVVEKPSYFFKLERDFSGWRFCGESYSSRIDPLLPKAANKLKSSPFTRRVSIPVWRPKDHFCDNPPAVTEVSLLPINGEIHATAFIRSLDAYNFFMYNADFITHVLETVSLLSGFEMGSAAMLLSIPHIYTRDVKKVERAAGSYREVYGHQKLATHLKEDYISTAWHSAMEVVFYHGHKKRTEWGEIFEGQKESKFVHRLFIEVENPYEHQIHDKAPFTKKYAIEYAHDYMIYAKCIDKPVFEPILKEGESYTYAERARYCEADEVIVDQFYTVLTKLKEDPYRRDCYIGISRPWDLESDEPPCLRGYQFIGEKDKLNGIFFMRSNDIYGAMHANAFAFSTLTQYVAELTGFEKHRYYHFAVDAHIYAEFLEAVKEILEPESPSYLSEISGM